MEPPIDLTRIASLQVTTPRDGPKTIIPSIDRFDRMLNGPAACRAEIQLRKGGACHG
jgi:hypothetical protein